MPKCQFYRGDEKPDSGPQEIIPIWALEKASGDGAEAKDDCQAQTCNSSPTEKPAGKMDGSFDSRIGHRRNSGTEWQSHSQCRITTGAKRGDLVRRAAIGLVSKARRIRAIYLVLI